MNRLATTDNLPVGPFHLSTKHIEESLVDQDPSLCFQLQPESNFELKLNPTWLEEARSGAEMPIMEMEEASTPPVEPSGMRPGQLEYEIPDTMLEMKPTICVIRIGDKEVKNMRISDSSTHAEITISDEMSVRLIDISGGNNFSIIPLTSERQAILKGDYTQWKIAVKPLGVGSFPLFLQITCHFDGKSKDVDILEKLIRVGGDPRLHPRKITFVAAGAKSGLLLGKESNEIGEELRSAPFRDDFLYVKYFDVTNIQFNRALSDEKPAIVHFSGHGAVEGLFLSDDHGDPKLVLRHDVAALFKVLQTDNSRIECVVLNACLSRDLAEELSGCVPTVIGTNAKIGDDKAIQFSEFFYRALGNRKTYKQAFDSGRIIAEAGGGNELGGEELLVCLVKD